MRPTARSPWLCPLHHLFARVEERRELVLRAGLRVDADERLGPGETDEKPRAVVQEELRAVVGVEMHDLRHRVAAELLWRGLAEGAHDPLLRRRVGVCLEVEVGPPV